MTGSTLQLINGILLLATFFCCRLVWGTYQSVRVFGDLYHAYNAGPIAFTDAAMHNSTAPNLGPKTDMLSYADGQTVPLWLAGAYLASNITLNGLNWFWFSKMIGTLRKRFDPPLGTRRAEVKGSARLEEPEKVLIEGTHVLTPAALGTDGQEYFDNKTEQVVLEKRASGMHLEVEKMEVKPRSSTRRRG
jgi:hypothetical protein